MECPQCHQRLQSIRSIDYFWAFALSAPYGILGLLALIGCLSWWYVSIGLFFALAATYLLNPYITKVELVSGKDKNAG
jgi:hypothetical protein